MPFHAGFLWWWPEAGPWLGRWWGLALGKSMLEELPHRRPRGAVSGAEPRSRGWRVPRVVSVVLVAIAVAAFWCGAVIMARVVVPLLRLTHRNPLEHRRVCQRVVSACFRAFLGGLDRLALFRVWVEQAPAAGPCVLVANHPTLLDVVAILAHVENTCCVVKAPLMNSALVGPLLTACGHIPVAGGDAFGGMRVLEEASQRLREGQRVLIFPEGTRSPPHDVRPFRRGAFELARRTGVPLVPVFMRCDPPALGKEGTIRRFPKERPVLRLRFLPPLETVESSRRVCRDVMEDFRHRIRQPAPQPPIGATEHVAAT